MPSRLAFAAMLLALALALPAGPASARSPVTLFAAASTTDAVRAVLDEFESRHPDVPVRASFAASSTLAKQIAHGAPADLYLSANLAWMDYLAEQGAVDRASRVDLLGNRLVLVVPEGAETPTDLGALPDLLADRRLALGEPSHVPAGRYAKAALESLGIWDAVRGRAAFASDVRAALALVARGQAAAAVVYATDARISERVRRAATFPSESHPPIRYPLARVSGRDDPGVRALYAFLRGPAAARLFRAHGFRVLSRAGG